MAHDDARPFQRRYPAELRERAIRLVFETAGAGGESPRPGIGFEPLAEIRGCGPRVAEPALTNCGLVSPDEGFWAEAWKRCQATGTLLDVMVASLKKQGREPDADELNALRQQVSSDYERQTDVRYAAARLWVDAILDPAETRSVLIQSLEIATRHASDEPFRVGVYQV